MKLKLALPDVDLEATRLQVRDSIAAHTLSERTLFGIEIALEEWLTNLRRFGAARVELQVTVTAEDVLLTFEDDGPAFNPLAATHPPRPTSLEEAQPGGLGLVMIEHVCHHRAYERRGAMNWLQLAVARRA